VASIIPDFKMTLQKTARPKPCLPVRCPVDLLHFLKVTISQASVAAQGSNGKATGKAGQSVNIFLDIKEIASTGNQEQGRPEELDILTSGLISTILCVSRSQRVPTGPPRPSCRTPRRAWGAVLGSRDESLSSRDQRW
jgi:hypothetical protein